MPVAGHLLSSPSVVLEFKSEGVVVVCDTLAFRHRTFSLRLPSQRELRETYDCGHLYLDLLISWREFGEKTQRGRKAGK